MSFTTTTPNMGLTLPNVSQEPGPQWATDINTSLTTVDQHNHAPGNGLAINSNGLNITQDLTINTTNLTNARTIRFVSLANGATSGTDLACIYVKGSSLYYNDTSGNPLLLGASSAFTTSISASTGIFNTISSTTIYNSGTLYLGSLGTAPSLGAAANNIQLSGGLQLNNSGSVLLSSSATAFSLNGANLTNVTLIAASSGILGTGQGGFGYLQNANQGYAGEELFNNGYTRGSPLAITTGNNVNLAQITLTPGDWDISASLSFETQSGAVTSGQQFSISRTSAVLSGSNTMSVSTNGEIQMRDTILIPASNVQSYSIPPGRASSGGAVNFYLVGVATFSGGNCNAYGAIRARRLR